ncbi:hypothetical protein [Lacisediminihabitans sp.]|uniref:hypothetical protein n=1 Tax=Lacisediminihabitans sp. TaxID=2787631 RepID=UPI00374CE8BA
MASDEDWLVPIDNDPLDGTEKFAGMKKSVVSFWQFALGDLRMNNARGYLAEFIVATALGISTKRVEWAGFDLDWQGVTIEVKSSAYLQSWDQRTLSKIAFSGLRAKLFTPDGGYSGERTYNADVYVFCVQNAITHSTYDPLDVGQWEFYVASNERVSASAQDGMALSTVKKIGAQSEPLRFHELAEAIRRVAHERP